MTPEGSHEQYSTYRQLDGSPSYSFRVVDGKIELQYTKEGHAPETFSVPAPHTYYEQNNKTYYIVDTHRGQRHVEASHVGDGTFWRSISMDVERRHVTATAKAFNIIANDLPVTETCPNVLQAHPPLGPVLTTSDVRLEDGIEAWAELANRLAPAGRLTLGAGLLAPWLKMTGGETSIWSLWGQAGAGKSILAQAVAALYGAPNQELGETLFGTFDTTPQGLSAKARRLSYYPLIIDEVQSNNSPNPEGQLVSIVLGAKRDRADREGNFVVAKKKWESICFATGNEPLPVTHQMFSRRIVEIDVVDLWQDGPQEINANDKWWSENVRCIEMGAGWPWAEIIEKGFTPGTPYARDLNVIIERMPLPPVKAEFKSIAKLLRLAYVGCQLLAEWTSNPAWIEGVWDKAVEIAADHSENTIDYAKAAAIEFTDYLAANRNDWEWVDDSGRINPRFSTSYAQFGFVSGFQGECFIKHEGYRCKWLDVPSTKWATFMTYNMQRLAKTNFGKAMHRIDDKHLSRQIRRDGNNMRVYTVCLPGMEVVAGLHDEPETAPRPDPNDRILTADDLRAQFAEYEAPKLPEAPTPVEAPESQPEASETELTPVYSFTLDEDVAQALDDAVARGVTDLCLPVSMSPQSLEQAGWATNGWLGTLESGWKVHKGTQSIRVRRVEKPQVYAEALADWAELTGFPVQVSLGRLGEDLLLHYSNNARVKTPRWHLRDDLATFWQESPVAHPAHWQLDLTEYGTGWDRNKSYLPSLEQANLAPLFFEEEYETYTGSNLPVMESNNLRKYAGMWQIIVPEWDDSVLPSPIGQFAQKDKDKPFLVSTEIMRLYLDRGIVPEVIRADLAPTHKIHAFQELAQLIRNVLDDEDVNRPAKLIAKQLYSTLPGKLMARRDIDPQTGKARPRIIYRPEWGWAIRDNSWANTLRNVYKMYDLHGWTPTKVHTDAIYYLNEETPQEIKIGVRPGQFKKVTA